MDRDNKDRYGKRHRKDDSYEIGESAPSDVGDSEGTFHDRSRKNQNVIDEDGEVRSWESTQSVSESNKQKKGETTQEESSTPQNNQNQNRYEGEKKLLDEVVGETVELELDRKGGTEDTLAQYYNHQVHIRGGSPGEKKQVKLKPGNGFLIGEPVTSS